MVRTRYPAVEPIPITVGQQLHLAYDRQPWTVQAVTEHFAALTRPVSDADKAEAQAEVDELEEDSPYREPVQRYRDTLDGHPVFYTVVDWRKGIRGPCNLIGQAWGDGTYTADECTRMLAEFEAGKLEVSHRNQVPIEFGKAQ